MRKHINKWERYKLDYLTKKQNKDIVSKSKYSKSNITCSEQNKVNF